MIESNKPNERDRIDTSLRSSSAWSVVPHLFFDLIGRFIPGAIIILSSVFVWVGPDNLGNALDSDIFASLVEETSFMLFFWLAIFSYFIADLLYQLFDSLFRTRWDELRNSTAKEAIGDCIKGHKALFQAEQSELSCIDNLSAELRIHFMHDALRIEFPSESLRLVKLRAEKRLSQVLMMGFGILAIVNFVFLFFDTTIFRLGLEPALLVAGFLSFSRAKRIERRYDRGVCSAWVCVFLKNRKNRN